VTRIQLGKIKGIRVGFGGYQEAMLGISFDLGGEDWGVGDFDGAWGLSVKPDANSKWNEHSRDEIFVNVMRRIDSLLREAKVSDVMDLVGIPIEVTFTDNVLESWRILKEVL
jgi:hypothetical protein